MTISDSPQATGAMLKFVREFLGYSIAYAARLAGVAESTLATLEDAKRVPSENQWQKLSSAYQCDLRQAFSEIHGLSTAKSQSPNLVLNVDPDAVRELNLVRWYLKFKTKRICASPRIEVMTPGNTSELATAVLNPERASSAESGFVDIYALIEELGLPIFLRPNLTIGGCFLHDPGAIVLPSDRPESQNRRAAARLLGYWLLCRQSPGQQTLQSIVMGAAGSNQGLTDSENLALDAFADELLLPAWLIREHCNDTMLSKSPEAFGDFIYQASLRLGVATEDLVRQMRRHGFLSQHDDPEYVQQAEQSKQRLHRANLLSPIFDGDIWVVTERDSDRTLCCACGDVLILDLPQAEESDSWERSEWRFDPPPVAGMLERVEPFGSSIFAGMTQEQGRMVFRLRLASTTNLGLVQECLHGYPPRRRRGFSFTICGVDENRIGIPRIDRTPIVEPLKSSLTATEKQMLRAARHLEKLASKR